MTEQVYSSGLVAQHIKELEMLAAKVTKSLEAKGAPKVDVEVLTKFLEQTDWENFDDLVETLEDIRDRLSLQQDEATEKVESVLQLVENLQDIAETIGYV